jgi:nitric oxide reductase subunit B
MPPTAAEPAPLAPGPAINYYEHGTFLTLNHAHTALFGAFGLLGNRPYLFLPALRGWRQLSL